MTDDLFAVTLTGSGRVFVRADDPEDAVDVARMNVDGGPHLEVVFDKHHAEHHVESVDDVPTYNDVVNESSDAVGVPTVPTVGELRRAREALGLSREDVASSVGVTRSTIGKWERGTIDVGLSDVSRYARTLDRETRRGDTDD